MTFFSSLRSVFAGRNTSSAAASPLVANSSAALGHGGLGQGGLGYGPAFSLAMADAMRFDPQIRLGLSARNGILLSAETVVSSDRSEVQAYVDRVWRRIWRTDGHRLARAKLHGFAPFIVQLSADGGPLEPRRLVDAHPRATRIVVRDEAIAGIEWRDQGRREQTREQTHRLLAPQALVVTFESEFGNPYGESLLARVYPAWLEKWADGGAKATLRLRMMKDSYLGDVFWYPADRQVTLPDGRSVSWRDLARDLSAARMSGAAMTLPLLYDKDGRKLVDYSPPRDLGGATAIFDWKRDVDIEIWKALEVPPEILEAAGTGSGYAGRSIPFLTALSAVQREFNEIVACVDRDLLRPLVAWNFGRTAAYEIEPRPLVETFSAWM